MDPHPDPSAALDALLTAEIDDALPPMLPFWGHTARADHPGQWVLSQWWPVDFDVHGVRYHHAEGYMMAEKARLFGDDATRERVIDAREPLHAKRLGRLVSGFEEELWIRNRYEIVVAGNRAKFGQHPDLRDYLVSTAPRVLVEASPVDRIWGVGLAPTDPAVATPSAWRGENLLGFALMAVRDALTSETDDP
ncbi:NADAR family protein [Stackebrandtia soli]|uniref:NADAR family protein n=1 Tax=Stackebrandtia soli TaxID=1892856 RepID=UPI0039EAAA6A